MAPQIDEFWHWTLIDVNLHSFNQFAARHTFGSRAEAELDVLENLSVIFGTPAKDIELVWEDRCKPEFNRTEYFISDKGRGIAILMFKTTWKPIRGTVH